MRADRLLKLADFLETVPPQAFDIKDWLTRKPSGPEGNVPGECGFAGCAVGWAAHQKMFDGFGFRPLRDGTESGEVQYTDEAGVTSISWEAVRNLFEVDRALADCLFDGSSYRECDYRPAPITVAKRIRLAVAE
jgi:hypothetical protein